MPFYNISAIFTFSRIRSYFQIVLNDDYFAFLKDSGTHLFNFY